MTYFLAKLLLNFPTKFVSNSIIIYITKFGDYQKSSLNLVKEFAQYFLLVLFLKKITKMVTIFVTKFGHSRNPSPNLVKKIALFKSIFVLKKNHQNGRDVRHQIW